MNGLRIDRGELSAVLAGHQKWLASGGGGFGMRADLSGRDLSCQNLQQANFERANLEGANLDRANLRTANLTAANLKTQLL